jgi:hypothetical protein
MTAAARCSVTELLVDECAHCREQARALDAGREMFRPPSSDQQAPTITARFGGWCTECGDRIEPGDRLVKHGDAWIHADDLE